MHDDPRAHLEVLRRSHLRRLHELEKQAATFGKSTPPQIIIEIEDIQSAIADIDRKLASPVLSSGVPSASTITPLVRQRSWWLRRPWFIIASVLLAIAVIGVIVVQNWPGLGRTASLPTAIVGLPTVRIDTPSPSIGTVAQLTCVSPASAEAAVTPAPTTALPQALVPELVEVPAGPFLMGRTDSYTVTKDDDPQRDVYLRTYWIGKTEMTNAQFRVFIDEKGYEKDEYWTTAGCEWRNRNKITLPAYWNDSNLNGAEQPVVGISWYEAMAYVRWLSMRTGREYRLPSEAEWEKAARGTDGRIWPWSNDGWKPEYADYANSEETDKSQGAYKKTTPVGKYPKGASPYGALDMAGNVMEWCATQWPNPNHDQSGGEWQTKYLEGTVARVLRGGAWSSPQVNLRAALRLAVEPRYRDEAPDVGFRVASDDPPPNSSP